ncbi:MAG: toll/interleukin-1 receptor domain-containing protein [Planctomycetaceae bacterium]|nr:toll/interleukin-1 receptor domain-containing protein [Planctomycetaceae bacterium]MCB9951674.1 toll/interleukin-1 receptor domain-containing protein [Planctomycetaceae bacterium]
MPVRVLISYSHGDSVHVSKVLQLSNALRKHGIDCWIDLYEPNPPEGWPFWMERQIESADHVLIACSENYLKRWNGLESPGVGHGVAWEAQLIRALLMNHPGQNRKFSPIIFDSGDIAHIPDVLSVYTRYEINTFILENENTFTSLVRHLTDQDLHKPSDLGTVPSLPPLQTIPTSLDGERRASGLLEFGVGPMIQSIHIPVALYRVYAEHFVSNPNQATVFLQDCMNKRLRANPEGFPERSIIVPLIELSQPAMNPHDFWARTISMSGLKGPRTLAALLTNEAAPNVQQLNEQDAKCVSEALALARNPPIR